MDAAVVVGLTELAKLGLQMYISSMKLAGKSDTEIQEMYTQMKEEFERNDPTNLPDV